MATFLQNQMRNNGVKYKKALDRIIDKYSKLQYEDGGIEVDLESTRTPTLQRYMNLSKIELSKLESKSLADLREESQEESRAQDVTGDSQLDFTYQDTEYDETPASTRQFFVEDDEMSASDTTQLNASSLHESEENFSETELQPEDQDEELEMTLRSHGTLVDLYPSMISRIERAWHRKNVSEAADSVLRRYRKWRRHSKRSNTSIVTPMTSRVLLRENRPEKGQNTRTEYFPVSPLKTVTKLQDWKAQQQFPGRQTGPQRREQHQPVLMMDLYDETSKPQETLLNETFSVLDLTQLGEQSYVYSVSPSQACYPSANVGLDRSPRNKRLSLSAHSDQAAGCSVFAPENSAVKERHVYSSPVRQSPLKVRMLTSVNGSPRSFSRSPKESCGADFSRETARSPSLSTSLSSLWHKPTRNMRVHQDSNHSQLPSLQSARAEGHVRLRRHLSFDSSQPSLSISYSPEKIDEDLKKLYHKFVCQNKSFCNSPPCRFCAERSGANRGHSSAALAALALSPHRSILRKRHRESGWDSHPQSKRTREEYYTYSPGSKRHEAAALRHRVPSSQLEQHQHGFPYSSSKHSAFQNLTPPQHSADTRMTQGRPLYLSGQGGTCESRVAHSYSPRCRKW